ncbi:hypothetical protein BB560_000849 [Smittium megazygosporum]|uniref:mRNA export factor GLE1 n=1 Tax=Smittium megazygosporum TaxID=133381 RepID=A0A2T9ZJD9_9FUNG|nr:hypothetical protein BB560_000849 [Smittium megazygosporum]
MDSSSKRGYCLPEEFLFEYSGEILDNTTKPIPHTSDNIPVSSTPFFESPSSSIQLYSVPEVKDAISETNSKPPPTITSRNNSRIYSNDFDSIIKIKKSVVKSLKYKQSESLKNLISIQLQVAGKKFRNSPENIKSGIENPYKPDNKMILNLSNHADLIDKFSEKQAKLLDIDKKKKIEKTKAELNSSTDSKPLVISTPEVPKLINLDFKNITTIAEPSLSTFNSASDAKIANSKTISTPVSKHPNSTLVSSEDEFSKKSKDLDQKLIEINTILSVEIKKNPDFKKYAFASKRKINLKVGQLTNSKEQIDHASNDINQLLNDARNRGDLIYKWILNLVSKSLVSQAETEIALKPEFSYPLAHTAVNLIIKHPELLEFLFKGESEYDLKKKLKYKSTDSRNISESQFEYQERMCGIISFYASIIQTTPKDQLNPIPIFNGWKWLSRMLNLPISGIYPSLITSFLSISGFVLDKAYKTQFKKIMQLLHSDYLRYAKEKVPESISSISRLESVLNSFFSLSGPKFKLSIHREP